MSMSHFNTLNQDMSIYRDFQEKSQIAHETRPVMDNSLL